MSVNYRKMKDEWKKQGRIPEWYSSNALQFFMETYSYEGEDVKTRDETTNKWLAKFAPEVYPDYWEEDEYFKGLTWEQAFNKLDWDGFTIKSTPLKANGGLPQRGLTVSCCGQDFKNSIAAKAFARGELEVLIKNSHGCSMTVSDWLAEGEVYDSDGNRSHGIIPIIDELQEATGAINQGIRRGVTLFGVDALHGDFWKVAKKLFDEADNLNIAWLMTDEFTKLLEQGDEETIKRWNKILYIRMAKGKGYFTKIDTMNRNKAQIFKDKDLAIKGSNLCVAPETLILTDRGYEVISDLENQKVNVWNGQEWSETTVVKTGENQQLIKVKLSIHSSKKIETVEIRATPYHKWFKYSGEVVRTFQLYENLCLKSWVDDGGEVFNVYVDSLEESDPDDTYCANEPKNHSLVFNSVLTGNCNEVNLPVTEDYSFTCVIINANLTMYRKFPKHLFHVLHVMQDCNVSGYIAEIESKTGYNSLFLNKVLKFTKDFRAVGTGVAGFHSLLMQEGIVFGSLDSFYLNNKIFKGMREDLKECSRWLAEVLGEPDGMKGTGMRNATLMMAPPTKSSAELARNTPSESINPSTALVKVKETVGGDIWRIEPVLLKLLKDKGKYNEDTISSIARNKGSVQHLDFLSQDEKDVLRIAFEIPMEAHLGLCSQRQKHIDQQQSINLYLASHDSVEYISEIHKKALLDEGINGLYYCYSSRGGSYERADCVVCT